MKRYFFKKILIIYATIYLLIDFDDIQQKTFDISHLNNKNHKYELHVNQSKGYMTHDAQTVYNYYKNVRRSTCSINYL